MARVHSFIKVAMCALHHRYTSRIIMFDDQYFQNSSIIKNFWAGGLQMIILPRNKSTELVGGFEYPTNHLQNLNFGNNRLIRNVGACLDYDGSYFGNSDKTVMPQKDISHLLLNTNNTFALSFKVPLWSTTDDSHEDIRKDFIANCRSTGFIPKLVGESFSHGNYTLNALCVKEGARPSNLNK